MDRGEDTRTIRLFSPHPLMGDPSEAVSDLGERVCQRHGGAKALAGDALPVGYGQIRKWAGDGDIPSFGQVLRLIRLAGPEDPLRPRLIAHLEHLFDPVPPDPDAIAARIEARLGRKRVSGRRAAQTAREVLQFSLWPEQEK